MSRPEAALRWPSAAAWVSALRLALSATDRARRIHAGGLRRVARRANLRLGMVSLDFASWNQLDGWLRQVDGLWRAV